MSLSPTLTLSLGMLLGPILTIGAQTILFDRFVSPTDNDLSSQFHLEGNYLALPDGGVTGGSVGAADGTGRATLLRPLDNGVGSALSTSIFFKYSVAAEPQLPDVSRGDGIITRLGLVTDPNQGVLFFRPSYGVFVELGSILGGVTQFGIYSYDPVDAMSPVLSRPTQAALVDGHWYRLGLNIHHRAAGVYGTSATVEDYGPSGSSTPQLLDSVTGDLSGPRDLLFDGQPLHAGWAGYWHVSHFDNFSAASIPEPGVVPLLMLGAIGLWWRKTRSNPRSPSTSGSRPSCSPDGRPGSRRNSGHDEIFST